MRTARTPGRTALSCAIIACIAALAACTPTTPAPPAPPSPGQQSTAPLPDSWPAQTATLNPEQVQDYKDAVAAYTKANEIVDGALADPKATKLPADLSKYADPDRAWVKNQAETLAAFRAAGWRTDKPSTLVVVAPVAGSVWNPNQVAIYVCLDDRERTSLDATGKAMGKGKIVHGQLRAELEEGTWRITGYNDSGGENGKLTETAKCGQDS